MNSAAHEHQDTPEERLPEISDALTHLIFQRKRLADNLQDLDRKLLQETASTLLQEHATLSAEVRAQSDKIREMIKTEFALLKSFGSSLMIRPNPHVIIF